MLNVDRPKTGRDEFAALFYCANAFRSLRLAVQDAALSRRKHGFDSRRERQTTKSPAIATYAPYPAGLLRRLAAAVYDLFLLVGVWIVSVLILLPFTGGRALDGGNPLFQAYLLYVPYLLFGWFWTHGGQTLGMRAWRIRVRCVDDQPLGWGRAGMRYIGAWLAWGSVVGMLWCAFDAQKRGWQDMFSKTELVVLPKDQDP